MTDVSKALGEISGKLDLVIAAQRDQSTRHEALEGRLRTVEQKQYVYAGAAGAVGAVLTAIFGHTFKWPF